MRSGGVVLLRSQSRREAMNNDVHQLRREYVDCRTNLDRPLLLSEHGNDSSPFSRAGRRQLRTPPRPGRVESFSQAANVPPSPFTDPTTDKRPDPLYFTQTTVVYGDSTSLPQTYGGRQGSDGHGKIGKGMKKWKRGG